MAGKLGQRACAAPPESGIAPYTEQCAARQVSPPAKFGNDLGRLHAPDSDPQARATAICSNFGQQAKTLHTILGAVDAGIQL